MRSFFWVFLVISSAFSTAASAAGPVLYATTGSGPIGALVTLDPATGGTLSSHALEDSGGNSYNVSGLAVSPITGVLYGVTSNVAVRSLVTVDPATGTVTIIGSLGGDGPVSITFTPDGRLWGWTAGSNALVSVNTASGLATVVGPSGLGATTGLGIASNPSGTLFFSGQGDTGALRTVNTANGSTTVVATLNGGPAPPGAPIGSLAFSGSVLYGVAGNASTGSAFLVTINTATGLITNVGVAASNSTLALAFGGVVPPTNNSLPAPSSLILLTIGLAGVAIYRWRFRSV